MVLTEKQFLIMFKVLEGSLLVKDDDTSLSVYGFDLETRRRVYENILNQQSNKIQIVESITKNKNLDKGYNG